MDATAQIISLLRADPCRWHLLGIVGGLSMRDGWIGAGFVRNAVWDWHHDRGPSPPSGDVDVIWHDPMNVDAAEDRRYEAILRAIEPSILWSVKNQARMHVRNGDGPYRSATDAMRYWPETATAIAVRRIGKDDCEVAAPYGLDDLLRLILRPTPPFTTDRRAIYDRRRAEKNWTAAWPLLRDAVEYPDPARPGTR